MKQADSVGINICESVYEREHGKTGWISLGNADASQSPPLPGHIAS